MVVVGGKGADRAGDPVTEVDGVAEEEVDLVADEERQQIGGVVCQQMVEGRGHALASRPRSSGRWRTNGPPRGGSDEPERASAEAASPRSGDIGRVRRGQVKVGGQARSPSGRLDGRSSIPS